MKNRLSILKPPLGGKQRSQKKAIDGVQRQPARRKKTNKKPHNRGLKGRVWGENHGGINLT